ncbi:Uncharacterised protein [Mycobacteroides abscessus subsp. abscessus]|nr:Uncharacterised protein [Mycobacteroides abscessus subsp. abscessus]
MRCTGGDERFLFVSKLSQYHRNRFKIGRRGGHRPDHRRCTQQVSQRDAVHMAAGHIFEDRISSRLGCADFDDVGGVPVVKNTGSHSEPHTFRAHLHHRHRRVRLQKPREISTNILTPQQM